MSDLRKTIRTSSCGYHTMIKKTNKMTNKQRNKHYLDCQCLSVINSNIYKIFIELFCGNGEQLYFSKFFEWALLVAGGHKALLNDHFWINNISA